MTFAIEVLPREDSCNQIEVVCALHAILDYVTISLANHKAKKPQPENLGQIPKNAVVEEHNFIPGK